MVPPHPISMSSQCAPRQSTLRSGCRLPPRTTLSMAVAQRYPRNLARGRFSRRRRRVLGSRDRLFPYFPRRIAALKNIIELLLVLKRVHRREIPIVLISRQLLLFDQPLERLRDQFLSGSHVLENVLLENKKPAIDANMGLRQFFDLAHRSAA